MITPKKLNNEMIRRVSWIEKFISHKLGHVQYFAHAFCYYKINSKCITFGLGSWEYFSLHKEKFEQLGYN